MNTDFPIATFLDIKHELLHEQKQLEKEKANWKNTRDQLSNYAAAELDKQFKTAFEEENGALLEELVAKGASAHLLGNHELGTHNLAMFVKSLYQNTDLDMAQRIIRHSIIAGADLNKQKAYAGNGGMLALEWLCHHMAEGVAKACCDTVFPWIALNTDIKGRQWNLYPFYEERIIFIMMLLGWNPFGPYTLFNRMEPALLTLLVPYEQEALQDYIKSIQNTIELKPFLNAFTSSNKARKHFKAFFSAKPHWVLKRMMEEEPGLVFNLIKRNEQDMLAPFLKHFKKELRANPELLQHAIASKGVVENTIRQIHQAGI